MGVDGISHVQLQKNDSLVLTAVMQDSDGNPIPITSGVLTVRGDGAATDVVYTVAADLSQSAEGTVTFAITPDSLNTPGPHLAAIVLRQGGAIQQTGALVIDVLDHA